MPMIGNMALYSTRPGWLTPTSSTQARPSEHTCLVLHICTRSPGIPQLIITGFIAVPILPACYYANPDWPPPLSQPLPKICSDTIFPIFSCPASLCSFCLRCVLSSCCVCYLLVGSSGCRASPELPICLRAPAGPPCCGRAL